MSKLFLFLSLFFFIFSKYIYAHGSGPSGYFLINQKPTVTNSIQDFGVTSTSFQIPNNFGSENYLVSTNINFEIDTKDLGGIVSNENLKNTKFEWDYGDGNKASGLKNSYAYQKVGSYILALTITNGSTTTPFVDSFLINIIPSKDFNEMPKAVIKIDGKIIKNPLKETLQFSPNKELTFDGSESSGELVECLWNFGDGQISNKKENIHKYTSGDFQTAILRVRDENGFISDAYVGLVNSERAKTDSSIFAKIIPLTIGFILITIVIAVLKKKLS